MQHRKWVLSPVGDRATEIVGPEGAPNTHLVKGDFLEYSTSAGFVFSLHQDLPLATVRAGSIPDRLHEPEPC